MYLQPELIIEECQVQVDTNSKYTKKNIIKTLSNLFVLDFGYKFLFLEMTSILPFFFTDLVHAQTLDFRKQMYPENLCFNYKCISNLNGRHPSVCALKSWKLVGLMGFFFQRGWMNGETIRLSSYSST